MPSDNKITGHRETTPRATYRIQFHEHFTLRDARKLVPYLSELGVSHIYASPLFKARPHSSHGYDTCDFSQLNPELGTEADLARLVGSLHEHGMGLVLDIAPNHMGIGGPENRWWWDVLARGPESPFAKYFDIDWTPPDPRLRGKVLAPVLGDRYHHVLARRELRVENRRGTCLLRYGDNAFPINAPSLQAVKASPEELNANPEALDALIEKQFYRLAWYGGGDSDLNYRRFCNISTLPGISIEDEHVFDQVFALAHQWLERGWLDGLRVDHLDGLGDPVQFMERLRALAPKAWIVAEKILEPDEPLGADWPIDGTTGYDFLNVAGGLFVDSSSEKVLTELYHEYCGNACDYAEVARDKRRLVAQTLFAAEIEHLTGLLLRISAANWRHRDFTKEELCNAIVECLACFPVYRTYMRPSSGSLTESDACRILEAKREAKRARPDLPADLFEFVSDLLLLKEEGAAESEFVTRFQQVCAGVMAKGAEDTAFYCFNRFVALNEVGGSPGAFGVSADAFHEFCQDRQEKWPLTMLATSTHDTKRGEDVRARLYLLTEIPSLWRDAVDRWSAMNKPHRSGDWPDRNIEYFYYQTLVGAWPLSEERAQAYMDKAIHEAKQHTSWSDKNEVYDAAVREFVSKTFRDPDFMADVERFVLPLKKPGCVNSLAQTLLKLTAPGVPDFYQGSELWNMSLVDPDNRRPVDFTLRQDLLGKAACLTAEEAWAEWESGLPKIWLTRSILKLRRQQPDLFSAAAKYGKIEVRGGAADHVVALKRGDRLIALAPRLPIRLDGDWRGAELDFPPGRWRNQLTGDKVAMATAPIAELLGKFPVALFVREDA